MLQEKDSWIVDDIRISGLQRVSAGSVFAVMPVGLGEEIDKELFKEIASSIFQTGKFDDVKLGRDGNALLIDLEERPTIDEIFGLNKPLPIINNPIPKKKKASA